MLGLRKASISVFQSKTLNRYLMLASKQQEKIMNPLYELLYFMTLVALAAFVIYGMYTGQ